MGIRKYTMYCGNSGKAKDDYMGNFKNSIYLNEEEIFLRWRKFSPSENQKKCNHEYIIHRKFNHGSYAISLANTVFEMNLSKIHIRCKKCGLIKKIIVNPATICFYNTGDKWRGKIKSF